MTLIPKLDVAGSIPVARSNLLSETYLTVEALEKRQKRPAKRPADSLVHKCQPSQVKPSDLALLSHLRCLHVLK